VDTSAFILKSSSTLQLAFQLAERDERGKRVQEQFGRSEWSMIARALDNALCFALDGQGGIPTRSGST